VSVFAELGRLTTSDWVVADGMTRVSFRRLLATLCMHREFASVAKNKIVAAYVGLREAK